MALNPFEQLRNVVVEPRQAFEEVCTSILRAVAPGARRVRVCGGDEGVDAFLGEWGSEGEVDVYQVKFFPDQLSSSQRGQIKDSYSRARESKLFNLAKWILCVPSRLTRKDLHWFDEWRNKQDRPIELLDGDDLTDMVQRPECQGIRDQLEKCGIQGLPQQHAAVLQTSAKLHLFPTPNSGIKCVCALRLKNEGNRSARNVRAVIHHPGTDCVAWDHDHSLWRRSPNDGCIMPRKLEALKPIHPGEEISLLRIPFQRPPSQPFSVEVSITADDLQPTRHEAHIAPEQWDQQRIITMERH